MPISLVPMTDTEIEAYHQSSLLSYAKEVSVNRDISLTEAMEYAQTQVTVIRQTDRHEYFHCVRHPDEENCGHLWVSIRKRGQGFDAYIYDIHIFEEWQGQGIGRTVMNLLEEEMKQRGIFRIALHVFGHNLRAQNLYRSLGYRPTNISMAKDL